MYHVRQVDFGYVLTLEGTVKAADMRRWCQGTRDHLQRMDGPFGVLVDARRCDPLSKGARFWLLHGQSICERGGLERAAVLVDSAMQEGYWPDLATAFRPAHRVRFVDAKRHYPRVRALSWILKGVEPRVKEGAVSNRDAHVPPLDEEAIVEATGLHR